MYIYICMFTCTYIYTYIYISTHRYVVRKHEQALQTQEESILSTPQSARPVYQIITMPTSSLPMKNLLSRTFFELRMCAEKAARVGVQKLQPCDCQSDPWALEATS